MLACRVLPCSCRGLYKDDDTNGHIDNFACFARPGELTELLPDRQAAVCKLQAPSRQRYMRHTNHASVKLCMLQEVLPACLGQQPGLTAGAEPLQPAMLAIKLSRALMNCTGVVLLARCDNSAVLYAPSVESCISYAVCTSAACGGF
jgi:hypothetical protein